MPRNTAKPKEINLDLNMQHLTNKVNTPPRRTLLCRLNRLISDVTATCALVDRNQNLWHACLHQPCHAWLEQQVVAFGDSRRQQLKLSIIQVEQCSVDVRRRRD